ncbi:unnamed protein product [Lathyrus sativus]|nr:unnamed protein product [Lathyrus sativus]
MSNSVATKKVEVSDNVHKDKDMLSNLPDCIILHILSFLITKEAVRTCILSSRWKDLWKHLPALLFHISDFRCFRTNKIFTEFVSKVLSLRDSSVSLHTLDFENRSSLLECHLLTSIVNYAISHNVQRLQLSVTTAIEQIPVALFSSQTLTHLTLSISICYGCENLFPKSLSLPALSTLELENFTFSVDDNDCAEPFSTFNRLTRLLISHCSVKGWGTLCISSATLVNFTMYNDSDDYYKIDFRTPSLCTFSFRGVPYQDISWSNISSLKHVDIDAEVFPYSCYGPQLFLFNWLSEFANIKSLTVTAATLQVLSLIPGLLKFKIPSLGKLKSLKVKIDEIQYGLCVALCNDKLQNVKSENESAMIQKAFDLGLELSPLVPDGIVDFLLQNSPSVEVDFVDCRKITS